MHAIRRTWRRVMYSTGANSRKRSLEQTSSRIFTRQRASRNSSGCWMRRLRRGETTVQRRRRRKTGHSTKAPRIHPHREPHRVCILYHHHLQYLPHHHSRQTEAASFRISVSQPNLPTFVLPLHSRSDLHTRSLFLYVW